MADQPRVYIKAAKCQDIRKQTSIFLDGWFRVNWEPWQAGHFVIDKVKKLVTISHDGIQFTIKTVHSVSTSRALIVKVDTNDAFYEFRFSHVAKRNRAYVFFREFCDIDQTVELLTAKWQKENCGKDLTSALPFDVIFLISKYLPFSDMMSLMHVSVQFWKGISTSDDIRQLFLKKCVSPHQGILKKNWILDLDHISRQPFTYKFTRCFPLDPVVNFHVKEDSRCTYCIDLPLWSGKYYYELVMHDWKRIANRNNFNFSFGWNGCKSRLLGSQLGNTTECSLTTAEIPIYSNMNWIYQHKMYRGVNITPHTGTASFWRDGNSKNTFVPIPTNVLSSVPARDTMCFGTTIDLDNGVLQYYCNGVCLDTITCLLSDTEYNKERTARQILPIIPTFYVENCQIDFLFSSTNVYNIYEGYTPIGDLCPNQTLFYFHKEIKETIYTSKKEKEKAKAKEREKERLRILEKEKNELASNILTLPTPSAVVFGDKQAQREELDRQIEVARLAVQKSNDTVKKEKKKDIKNPTALKPMPAKKETDKSASGEEGDEKQRQIENIAANLSKKSQKTPQLKPSHAFAPMPDNLRVQTVAEQKALVNNEIGAMFVKPEVKEATEPATTPKPQVPSGFPVFDFEDSTSTTSTFAPLPNSAFPSFASSSSESKSLSTSGSLNTSSAVSPPRKPGAPSSTSSGVSNFQFGFESEILAPSSFQFGGKPKASSGFSFGTTATSPDKADATQPPFSFGSPSFSSPSPSPFQFGHLNNSPDYFASRK